MKLTCLGHASYLLVDTAGSCIFFDPVLGDTHQEGLFAHYPERHISHEALPAPHLIVVSHRHMDHFDAWSLARFDRDVPLLIPHDPVLASAIRDLGFETVEQISPGQSLRVGSISLTATPSLGLIPEIGILVEAEGMCLWNQVDTVINEDIAQAIAATHAPDLALVRWQPLQDTMPYGTGTFDFPADDYAANLAAVGQLGAGMLALGACGFHYVGEHARWNHVVFPQARGRALKDFAAYLDIPVHAADPGTSFALCRNGVKLDVNSSPLVRSLGRWDESLFARSPWHPEWPELPAAQDPAPAALILLDQLRQWWGREGGAIAQLRTWEVRWHVRIVGCNAATDLTIDFSGKEPRVSWAKADDATITCYIEAETMANLASGSITWDKALLSGKIFQAGETYRIRRGEITFPADALPDPLFCVLGQDDLWLAAQACGNDSCSDQATRS